MKPSINVAIGASKRSSFGVKVYTRKILSELSGHDLNIKQLDGNSRTILSLLSSKNTIWYPAFYGSLVQKNQVITIHDVINLKWILRSNLIRACYKAFQQQILNADPFLVFISESTKDEFFDQFPNHRNLRWKVIKSGNDPFSEIELQQIHGFVSTRKEDKKIRLLWITNNLPHKNNKVIIDSLEDISNNTINKIELTIVGLDKISQLQQYENLTVQTLTNISRCELIELYGMSDIIISPSLAEGHNLCLAEGQQAGLKLLCSDIKVHREYYSESAIFFDPNDKYSLTNKLIQLVNNYKQNESKTLIKSNLTFGKSALKYIEIFKELNADS